MMMRDDHFMSKYKQGYQVIKENEIGINFLNQLHELRKNEIFRKFVW